MTPAPPPTPVPPDAHATVRSRTLAVFCLTVAALLITGGVMLIPAYMSPDSRMYSSALGYSAVRRALKLPFEVDVAVAQSRPFDIPMHGEGSVQCDFVFVPVVPMSRVIKVGVTDGDLVYAGQEIARLDDAAAAIQVESARVAVATAEAEERRVNIGSAYVMAQERPEKDRIQLEEAEKLMAAVVAKTEVYRKLAEEGALSGMDLAKAEAEVVEAKARLEQARFSARMSEAGVTESRAIAANAVRDARNLLRDRERKLAEHVVRCPVEGIVERVLVREGEFNQDSGKPGFIVTTGRWFEAHFDQRALDKLQPGQEGVVYLEAMPGRPLRVRVQRIIPIVSFNQGGPESTRPIRPQGTGSPDWPATFPVRLVPVNPEETPAVGMTGFARVVARTNALALPRTALLSVGSGRSLVRVLQPDGGHRLVAVRVGEFDETHAQILEGLSPGDRVLVSARLELRDGDKIRIRAEPEAAAP